MRIELVINFDNAIGISDVAANGEVETGNDESHDVYDFKINMDNLFLKSELKAAEMKSR